LFLKNILLLITALLLFALSAAAQAQAARVLDSQGTTLVERSGQPPRLLGRGEALSERDVISVARDSWAILEFNDQTRITLRPNTVFRLDAYRDNAPESMLLGLTKGGLRVVTGLLGKRNPEGVRIQTATATIGIRGTEFDARLCEADCAAEERTRPAPRPVVLPVARVVEMNGLVGAGSAGEPVRLLVPGAMLNEGDAVAVARGSSALLVFRDGARVALAENSRFAINRFRYNESQPREGSAFLTLYDGNALVSTGQIAKISPDAFQFRSALGVIRPFGTTFGAGGCVGGFCASGSVTVNSDGASASGSASGGGASASASGKADSGGASGTATASGSGGGGATINASTGTPALPGQAPAGGRSGPPAHTSGTGQTLWVPDIAKTPAGSSAPVPIPYPNMSPEQAQQVDEVVAGVQRMAEEVAGNAANQGRTTTNQIGNAGSVVAGQARNAMEDTANAAASAAVNALNSTTAPVIAEMTALVRQLRSNPPQTEAAFRQAEAALGQLMQRLNTISGQAMAVHSAAVQSDAFQRAVALMEAMQLSLWGGMQMFSPYAAEEMSGSGTRVVRGVGTNLEETSRRNLAMQLLGSPEGRRRMEMVGISASELAQIAAFGGTPIDGSNVVMLVQNNVADALAAQGRNDLSALFAEAKSAAEAQQQEAARRTAEAQKAASDARVVAEKLAAEQKQRAAEEAARKAAEVEKLAAAAKAAAEAKLKDTANSLRSYDITGGQISVVGPPDTVLPPGILQTLPGEPVVTRVGDRVITTWVETVVNVVNTAHGGNSISGTVTRTEIVGPEGTTTTLAFNVQFVDPMVFPGPVPAVGGPLISLGPDKPGTVQVTHRAPDGTTTVSYPDNTNNKPASVAVTEGEVEIVGRGRVRAGEMLASTGSPVRVPGLTKMPLVKAADNSFGSIDKAVEEGLYVWVRDGAVRVTKDADSVDVAAGNAAVVTDRVRLLDVVPNFMRFDGTPRPLPSGSGSVFDSFRAKDGAILNMCSIK
jgi:hypothetical protein